MLPQRFDQSSCLKCHHQVVDLEPTERFPEPPAPKLVEGYHLVRQYGCYGCHEINGWANPDKRIGPDMRLAPNYHEVAQSISIDPGLASASGPVTRWIDEVSAATDGKQARERLREYIDRDAASDNATLSPRTHQLASLLKEPETLELFQKLARVFDTFQAKWDLIGSMHGCEIRLIFAHRPRCRDFSVSGNISRAKA